MNFLNVLLVCLGGIAGCVTLVFAVETLVAFCFHEADTPARADPPAFGVFNSSAILGTSLREADLDKAA